ERLVTLAPFDTKIIDASCFPADLKNELDEHRRLRSIAKIRKSLKTELQNFEANLIRQTLKECRWNQSETARRLQTSEKNIRDKMQHYQIKKSPTQ
ncbi:MAG: hypothetical protein JXL67_08110, partial [Calditrichaeota bacterium]|nr:hypothetical protein [Calditrichota bacterium]